MSDDGKVVLLQSIFRTREAPKVEDYGLEDMSLSVQRGYIAGEKMMDGLFQRNNVFAMDGKPIDAEKVTIPHSSDPDFIDGFNAGVSDYMQGNVVEFYELVQALAAKAVDRAPE